MSPGAAQASLWTFQYTATAPWPKALQSQLDQYSGVIDVENNVVVSVTGTSNLFGAITGLIAAGRFANEDNGFLDTSPYLSDRGFSFLTESGRSVNLIYFNNDYVATSCVVGSCVSNLTVGTFTAAVAVQEEQPAATVPEPASLALVGLGLVGMGLAGRRKAG